jgi:hypothetical protein
VSTKHITTLKDFSRFGVDILVTCKCGKQSVVPYTRVMELFHRKGWSYDLESAKSRFRCLGCKKQASRLEAANY